MKTCLLLWLLVLGGINLFVPDPFFFVLVITLVMLLTSIDNTKVYTSSFSTLLPFLLLIIVGFLAGLDHTDKDLFRDVFIFSKNIIYFITGIALSRYIKDFNTFFTYFLTLAFASSLIHIGLILTHLHSISSLETIREVAGYANSVEGIALSLFLSQLFSKNFRNLTGGFNLKDKIMSFIITISFLLYFSRALTLLIVVVLFFLTDTLYIRKIFSRKNSKLFKSLILILVLVYLISLISKLLPANSPVRTLVEKFENIPDEITWNAKKNSEATKEEIQKNWRGYEAYQGMFKFNRGNDLQKAFGFGFGERVNLGIIMKLENKDFETVPILHNEYVTLLVKSGIVGLLLYLFFLYKIGCVKIKYEKDNHPELYYSYQMLSALSIVSLLNTYIGFGLLDPTNAAIPIFLGFFWGNIQRNKNAIPYNETQNY